MDADKILSCNNYCDCYNIQEAFCAMEADCEAKGNRGLLDMGCHLAENSLYAGGSLDVYGCKTDETDFPPVFHGLYRQVYSTINEIPQDICGDAVFAGRVLDENTACSFEESLPHLLQRFRNVYVSLPYADTPEHRSMRNVTYSASCTTAVIF